jgi:hypothetical protein
MKGAWNLLQEKYQTLIIYGCSAHGLNLLAEDIATLEDFSNIIAHTKKMCRHFAINIFPANYSRKFKQKVEMTSSSCTVVLKKIAYTYYLHV